MGYLTQVAYIILLALRNNGFTESGGLSDSRGSSDIAGLSDSDRLTEVAGSADSTYCWLY
jgi:hypothetical protein